jgi:hypothetical protein
MKTTMQKNTVFRVYVNQFLVDTVFACSSMTAEEVRGVLINHDGYVSNIKVVKQEA